MLKPIFILLLSLFASNLVYAQKWAYLPNGTRLNYKAETIGEVLDSIMERGATPQITTDLAMVYYRPLTNKPVLVAFNSEVKPQLIPALLKRFDYHSYLNSYEFYYEVKSMAKNRNLTKTYLDKAFAPTDKPINIKDADANDHRLYPNHHLDVTLKNDTVSDFEIMNFVRIYQLGLRIDSLTVTNDGYNFGFDIKVTNLGKKTIKYLTFKVSALNAVHDVISNRYLRAIGPLKPTYHASYDFKQAFYTSTGRYCSIDQMKVEYMDGTIQLISRKDISDIQVPDWETIGHKEVD